MSDRSPGVPDLGQFVSGHPDNAALASTFQGQSGTIGATWRDLANRTAGVALQNGPSWSATQFGQYALTLDGVSQFASSLGNPAPQAVTVAAWAYYSPASWTGAYRIVSARGASGVNGWLLSPSATGLPRFGVGGTALVLATGATPSPVQTWVRYYGTAFNGNISIYANGILQGAAAYTPPINYLSDVPLFVGAEQNTAGSLTSALAGTFWPGQITGLRIWARGGSAAEAMRDYEWSRSPARDPRNRRFGGNPTAAASALFAFLPFGGSNQPFGTVFVPLGK